MVEELQAFDAGAVNVGQPTAAEVAAINARRAAAFAKVERWYQDWATTFRTVFSTREQLQLGLTDLKGKKEKKEKKAVRDATAPVVTPVQPA